MKLMVIDGNSILNRAFYGIKLLTTKDGLPTNAVYGFLNILLKLTDEEKPDALCVTFDRKAPTFRHLAYEGYKAQRKGMPDELAAQLPVIKDVLDAMNIPRYELDGWEADDLIGTIAARDTAAGWDTVIVTGDKDSLQLVTESTRVKLVSTRMGQTTTREMTPDSFREAYGFDPIHIIDLKALMGDASDNIPGVKGIGEKTAMDLIQRYQSVAAIYAGLDTLEPARRCSKSWPRGRSRRNCPTSWPPSTPTRPSTSPPRTPGGRSPTAPPCTSCCSNWSLPSSLTNWASRPSRGTPRRGRQPSPAPVRARWWRIPPGWRSCWPCGGGWTAWMCWPPRI